MGKRVYESLPDLSLARNRSREAKLIREEVKVSPRLSEFAKGKKYFVKTFGCQANVRDQEILGGYLSKAGFSPAENEENADVLIINTCAVRENAEEKVYGEIGKYKKKAKENPDFVLGICGCMMQEEGKAKAIMESYPYVNLIFGTHNLSNILLYLDEHLSKKKDIVNVASFAGDIIENLPSTRLDKYSAFVNIAYGCDKFCTYCIVPYTRGKERSRPKEDILKECKELVEQGYQQITLLGQNVNSYGKDFKDGTSFATILEEVAKLGIPRLRFMTSHPWDFSDEMLDVIAAYPNIMKCIHLPVQSGSNEILRLMGRRYNRESYLDLVRRIKAKIPGVSLTTDIIVGFPNENEEEFLDTYSLCEEVRYDSAFTFIYSPRKGTPAAKMVDSVSDEDKHRRFDKLLKLTNQTTDESSARMLNTVQKVLVDGPSKKDPEILSGYTENNKLVNFKGPSYLEGEIVEVKIVENHCFYLSGELLEDPILIKAKKVQKNLMKEEIVRAYEEAKMAYENSLEIKALKKRLKESQITLANSFFDEAKHEIASKDYLKNKKDLETHPLLLNLKQAQEELEELLNQVKEVLQ